MWPLRIVFAKPVLGQFSNLLQFFENVIVQDLLPKGAVEPLHEGILCGLPRLDEFQVNNGQIALAIRLVEIYRSTEIQDPTRCSGAHLKRLTNIVDQRPR